jgi:hypothetical protein
LLPQSLLGKYVRDVPAGGFAPGRTSWVRPKCKGFFLPKEVLSEVFRGKFYDGLKSLFRRKELAFHGSLQSLQKPHCFALFLRTLHQHQWVVYVKKPFGGPEHVLHYLARYTHRVAISNHRLISLEDGKVTFGWKDHAHGGQQRNMTLADEEFIRRFLMHVLPKGFVRIRHCGWMANHCRRERTLQCRVLLEAEPIPLSTNEGTPVRRHPLCGGVIEVIETILPRWLSRRRASRRGDPDSL